MAERIEEWILIDAEPSVVYDALVTPKLLEKWLCHEAEVEPTPAGRYTMRWSAKDGQAEVRYEGAAEILDLTPGERLRIRLDPGDGPGRDSTVEFKISRVDGQTELRLIQSGFRAGAQGRDERDGYARGWLACLTVLRSLIEDEPAARLTPASMHRDLPCPGSAPCGIEWVDGKLWLSDADTGRIYQLDPRSGEELRSFAFDGEPSGLTYDGEHLWQAEREEHVLVKLTLADGRVAKRVRVDQLDGELTGLAFDGSHLWVGVSGDDGGSLARLNPRSGAVLTTIDFSPTLSGLAWDGKRLWVADYEERTVSCLDTRRKEILRRIVVKGHPTGLTWDGERLWYADSEWQVASRILDDVFRI